MRRFALGFAVGVVAVPAAAAVGVAIVWSRIERVRDWVGLDA